MDAGHRLRRQRIEQRAPLARQLSTAAICAICAGAIIRSSTSRAVQCGVEAGAAVHAGDVCQLGGAVLPNARQDDCGRMGQRDDGA